jgi:hypothetical protein
MCYTRSMISETTLSAFRVDDGKAADPSVSSNAVPNAMISVIVNEILCFY